ncbi:hypothetical protein ACSVDE_03625 [Pseudalkalibacillus sp. Hm43]
MERNDFPVAHLSEETLDKIQKFEKNLQSEEDDEIILIAYQKERE